MRQPKGRAIRRASSYPKATWKLVAVLCALLLGLAALYESASKLAAGDGGHRPRGNLEDWEREGAGSIYDKVVILEPDWTPPIVDDGEDLDLPIDDPDAGAGPDQDDLDLGEGQEDDPRPAAANISEAELRTLRRQWSKMPLPRLDDEDFDEAFGRVTKRELFLNNQNYKKLLKHYASEDGAFSIKNARSFPDANLAFLRYYDFDTCAVVGNSGQLLRAAYGRAIDSHRTVLRFNQAPQGDAENYFGRHVGTKTTFRLVNTRWTNKYGTVHFLDQGLPLEMGVTLIVTRARPTSYDAIAQTLKKSRPDVRLLYLSSRVVSASRALLVRYRAKLERAGFRGIPGGNTPSSGLVGVAMLLQACSNVTVYGFGLDNNDGRVQDYHYFHLLSPQHSKRKNSMVSVPCPRPHECHAQTSSTLPINNCAFSDSVLARQFQRMPMRDRVRVRVCAGRLAFAHDAARIRTPRTLLMLRSFCCGALGRAAGLLFAACSPGTRN